MDHSDLLAEFQNPRPLKKGGQKQVYRAHAAGIGEVVVKIGVFQSPISLERARREVETLQRLKSPYYPRQYRFQVAGANRFVIVEEYIDSVPLSDRLHQFDSANGAVVFVRELVLALQLLWEQRIVHRDVKPDNILVRPNGKPVVIDLGIARLLNADSLTVSHAPRGPCTPVYAAPEQLKNRKAAIDARTDQFGLGIILAQMLNRGVHPFDPAVVGSGDSIVDNILADNWRGLSVGGDVPKRTVEVTTRLLGHEPHQRYRNAAALRADLNEILGEMI